MDGQGQLDTRALEVAVGAQKDLAAHEKICGERYAAILRAQEESKVDRAALRVEISDKFRGLYGHLWKIAFAILGAQAAIIAWLASRALPGGAP